MTIYTGPYVGARRCTNGPQPGAWGAMDYYTSAYKSRGGVSDGIYNCRSVRGGKTTSIHGEGRAADFGVRPYGASYGTALANAIVAHSKELGVQCVIWNRKIWSSAYPHSGWRPYHGVDPHTGHLHVELTWNMAKKSRSTVAKHWAKVLGGVKPGDVKVGGGGGSSSKTYKSISGKTPLVKLYTKGEPVKRAQLAIGMSKEDADGYWGPTSVAKAKKWQKANGLTADGMIGDKSWAVINGGKAKKPAPSKTTSPFSLPKGHFYYTEDSRRTVHSGYWKSDRAAIRKIQKKVGTKVDGGYGTNTKSAVMKWQKKNGLKADGAVGASTWKKMFG